MNNLGKRVAVLETRYSPKKKPWGLFSFTKAGIPARIAKAIADGLQHTEEEEQRRTTAIVSSVNANDAVAEPENAKGTKRRRKHISGHVGDRTVRQSIRKTSEHRRCERFVCYGGCTEIYGSHHGYH